MTHHAEEVHFGPSWPVTWCWWSRRGPQKWASPGNKEGFGSEITSHSLLFPSLTLPSVLRVGVTPTKHYHPSVTSGFGVFAVLLVIIHGEEPEADGYTSYSWSSNALFSSCLCLDNC